MGREKLLGIQYLRAIAALMVVYFHLIGQIPAYSSYLVDSHWIRTAALPSGVHIFFVISGFVMYLTAIESRPGRFAWRRIARIVPLYWLLTIAIAVLAVAIPHLMRRTDFTPSHLLKSLLFIPYADPTHPGGFFPMLVPGWSLNFEMFFYGVFALALFAPMQWRLPMLLLMLGALWEGGRLLGSNEANSVYTSPLIILFALGLTSGWVYRRGGLRFPPIIGAAVVAGGFIALIGPWKGGLLSDFGASAAIVGGTASLDFIGVMPPLTWLATLGDASYSLYLAHLFAFGITRTLWLRLGMHGALGAESFAVTSVLAAIGLALVTYRFIERPALALLTNRQTARTYQASKDLSVTPLSRS